MTLQHSQQLVSQHNVTDTVNQAQILLRDLKIAQCMHNPTP